MAGTEQQSMEIILGGRRLQAWTCAVDRSPVHNHSKHYTDKTAPGQREEQTGKHNQERLANDKTRLGRCSSSFICLELQASNFLHKIKTGGQFTVAALCQNFCHN